MRNYEDLPNVIAHLNYFVKVIYILHVDARWLYIARRKKKKESSLIQGTRFLSILFNFVNIRGVVKHIYRTVSIRAMVPISHSVKA